MDSATIFIIVIVLIITVVYVISSRTGRDNSRESYYQRRTEREQAQKRSQTDKATVQQLLSAYQNRRRLIIRYETGSPRPEETALKARQVDIYGINTNYGYMEAFCHYRQSIRVFKISRVLSASALNETFHVPAEYIPSGWVTKGEGEIAEDPTELVEISTAKSDHPQEIATHEPEEMPLIEHPDSPQEVRKEVSEEITLADHADSQSSIKPPQIIEEHQTRSRYDNLKMFEESIRSPFPEEFTPASDHLHEAHRLEDRGADQKLIDQELEEARKLDPDATELYILRQTIIRKRKQHRHKTNN